MSPLVHKISKSKFKFTVQKLHMNNSFRSGVIIQNMLRRRFGTVQKIHKYSERSKRIPNLSE